MFERIDVLGATDYTLTRTAHARARGWDAAFGAGVVRVTGGQSCRGASYHAVMSGAGAVVRFVCDTATRAHDHTA